MKNIAEIKLGIVVGSTDWMPQDLAIERRKKLVDYYKTKYGENEIYECQVCLNDNEVNVKRVLKELEKAECNALCLYFANYGPESTGSLLINECGIPAMMIGAAEEGEEPLQLNRTDAMSGFINACYALKLRKVNAYIPTNPIGTIEECSLMINDFISISRAIISLRNLKLISIGPRPSSYLASMTCINPIYDLGIDVSEYSELELFNSYERHKDDSRIANLVTEMASEVGGSSQNQLNILSKYAQYEVTIEDWMRTHKGNKKYVTMTSTCWPAFPVNFGFTPCYVNSRMTGKGYPISCEVDIYGAISEYVGQVVSDDIVTILNINNNVPKSVYDAKISNKKFVLSEYNIDELFIGYHCGVTSSNKLLTKKLDNHFVNNLLIGEEKSKGTIHGRVVDGVVTMLRIQADVNGELIAYVAKGEILPVDINTYGGYGIIGLKNFDKFFREIILEKGFTNHVSVVFGDHYSKVCETLKQLNIKKENTYFWR